MHKTQRLDILAKADNQKMRCRRETYSRVRDHLEKDRGLREVACPSMLGQQARGFGRLSNRQPRIE